MKIRNLLFIILPTFLLVSCDPGLINNYVVENNSDYDINITIKVNKLSRSDIKNDSINRTYLQKTAVMKIASYGQIGTAHDKGDHFLEDIDTLIIETGNLKLAKNIYDRSNWKINLKKSFFSMDEANYTLVINNKDFN
jgi:hypothetical protein